MNTDAILHQVSLPCSFGVKMTECLPSPRASIVTGIRSLGPCTFAVNSPGENKQGITHDSMFYDSVA